MKSVLLMPPKTENTDITVLLPSDGWKTKIVEKKVIEGEADSPLIQLHFFLNIKTRDEFKKWLTEFENLTCTSYTIANTDIEDGSKIVLKQRLRCHHFTGCKKTYKPGERNNTKNTNCPSKLTVKIHVVRKKYRGNKLEKYEILREMPCEVTLISTHNHTTNSADFLRFRKVSNSVREELITLFQNGHTPATALEMIKCRIQVNSDDYVKALADRSQCPSYKYCYDLYVRDFKGKYERKKPKRFLKTKLTQRNTKKSDKCTLGSFQKADIKNELVPKKESQTEDIIYFIEGENSHKDEIGIEFISMEDLQTEEIVTEEEEEAKCPLENSQNDENIEFMSMEDIQTEEIEEEDAKCPLQTPQQENNLEFLTMEDLQTEEIVIEEEDAKRNFHETMGKVNDLFNYYYEKSPLQVLKSVEKMMDTLEKIRTPAEFSSAVATCGLSIAHRRSKRQTTVQNKRSVIRRKRLQQSKKRKMEAE